MSLMQDLMYLHNIETVRRLTPKVRDPRAGYDQSLVLLQRVKAHAPTMMTKSSIMVGVGETKEEIIETMADFTRSQCRLSHTWAIPTPNQKTPQGRVVYHPKSLANMNKSVKVSGLHMLLQDPWYVLLIKPENFLFANTLRKMHKQRNTHECQQASTEPVEFRTFESDWSILSESPQSTPFLNISSEKLITLPCSDSILINTALGMGISGARTVVSMSTNQELFSLYAILSEERYGSEFSLPIVFLIPCFQSPATPLEHSTTYCRTGQQLYNTLSKSLQSQALQVICYNPAALFDIIDEQELSHHNATVHSSGTHISLFVCGADIEEAMTFAQTHDDVELVGPPLDSSFVP